MGYSYIFWSLIFMIDLRIKGVDYLPDFMAFIFLYKGLKMLADRNEHFNRAAKMSFPMIFLSIVSIYRPINGVISLGISIANPVSGIVGIPIAIYYLIIIYEICMGIAVEARKLYNSKVEKRALYIFKLNIAQRIALVLGILFGEQLNIYIVLVANFVIIVHIDTMILIKQAQKYLDYKM